MRGDPGRSLKKATWVLAAAALAPAILAMARTPPWPDVQGEAARAGRDPAERLPAICIGTTVWSAGQLGRSLLFRARRDGDVLSVGVFVHWTTERPWGANWLTYAVVPALLMEAVYTHLGFVLPGLQRAIYGPGDVEGVEIDFRRRGDGGWIPVAAMADDAAHRSVALVPEDFVADDGRLVFLTNVWSHQLSGKGGRAFAREHGDRLACYAAGALRPLDDETIRVFRLGSANDPRRAPPAWRERARP